MKDFVYKVVIHFFSLFFPVVKKKILFLSYYGNQYGCSPKYLSEYFLQKHPDYDIVWAFTNPDKYSISGIRKVRYYSWTFFYELCTAKVIVTNYRMIELFRKRSSQLYIQTWHSSLRLKTIEKDAEEKLPVHYVEMAKHDSQYLDALISGCAFSSEIFKRAFWYSGKILETGTPRNDLFFRNTENFSSKIKKQYGLPQENNLLLYAPTFRQGNSVDCYNINYSLLKEALTERFGGEWSILVRLHPHLRPLSEKLLAGSDVVDVTAYDDIQELLAASQVLITDYSSLMFDFALTERPCFLYVPDLQEYVQKDRKLYFEVSDLPFIKVMSNDDLYHSLLDFDQKKYEEKLREFSLSIGSFEDGKACQRIADYICNECNKD